MSQIRVDPFQDTRWVENHLVVPAARALRTCNAVFRSRGGVTAGNAIGEDECTRQILLAWQAELDQFEFAVHGWQAYPAPYASSVNDIEIRERETGRVVAAFEAKNWGSAGPVERDVDKLRRYRAGIHKFLLLYGGCASEAPDTHEWLRAVHRPLVHRQNWRRVFQV